MRRSPGSGPRRPAGGARPKAAGSARRHRERATLTAGRFWRRLSRHRRARPRVGALRIVPPRNRAAAGSLQRECSERGADREALPDAGTRCEVLRAAVAYHVAKRSPAGRHTGASRAAADRSMRAVAAAQRAVRAKQSLNGGGVSIGVRLLRPNAHLRAGAISAYNARPARFARATHRVELHQTL